MNKDRRKNMNVDRNQVLLYAVTDRSWLKGGRLAERVEDALKGGVTFVQLREKHLHGGALLEEAREIRVLCRRYGVPLIINDDVELAAMVDADGVHVGQADMDVREARKRLGEGKIIGVSAHSVEEAVRAQNNGADYLGAGAVFATSTKKDAGGLAYETLQAICRAVDIPVVAIGGIGMENVHRLSGSGISGVAVVSALFAQEDIEAAARELKCRVRKVTESRPVGRVTKNGPVRKVTEDSQERIWTGLTIAGSDSSGGAGIQADIKTMFAHGGYAMSVVTALTAQNTLGVAGIMEVTPEFLAMQLDCIFTDIFPDAVKVGMVSSPELIGVIGEKLRAYEAENIVVDPVMVATSGARLMKEKAVSVLKKELLPLAAVVTPNIPEAEVLAGMEICSEREMEQAAQRIGEECHCAVLCKGGHRKETANDLLYDGQGFHWFYGERVDNPNTHGTGCTLSSAIAANLARGRTLSEAVEQAKRYLSLALADGLDLGKGKGPMNHGWCIRPFKP